MSSLPANKKRQALSQIEQEIEDDQDRFIHFHDGGKQRVSARKAKLIWKLSNPNKFPDTDRCEIDGNSIKFSSISRIEKVEDYYEDNPKERPANTHDQYEEHNYNESVKEEIAGSKQALNDVISGLKQYCDDNPESTNAKAKLNAYIEKFKSKFGKKPKDKDTLELNDYGLGLMTEKEKEDLLEIDAIGWREDKLVITDPVVYNNYRIDKNTPNHEDQSLDNFADGSVDYDEEMTMEEIEDEFS